jgi:putative SOS response-associated peptidase YedK
MCGRFVQVITLEKMAQRFGAQTPDAMETAGMVNIAPGDYAYVITNKGTAEIKKMRFGLNPSWSKKAMYLFNARAEGDFNAENATSYKGEMGIFQKPAFKKPIRSQRCLVMANAFIEGPENVGLDHPFAIYLKDKEPFAMAGIWDTWLDTVTGKEIESFAIITSTANSLLQKIPHHRSPVVLMRDDEAKWLDPSLPLNEVLQLLKPFPGELMMAEPISLKIKNPKNKDADLLIPIGPTVTSESDIQITKDVKLKGMGTSKRKGDPPPWQGTLF